MSRHVRRVERAGPTDVHVQVVTDTLDIVNVRVRRRDTADLDDVPALDHALAEHHRKVALLRRIEQAERNPQP